jgi:hypothetical protein
MGEPARGGADGPRPEHPAANQLDPRKRVWGDVMSAIIASLYAAEHAVTVLECHPDGAAALKQAALTRDSFDLAVEIGRQWVIDEAVLAEQRQRGFDEGVEWCKAQRCRLEVIDGGLAVGPH